MAALDHCALEGRSRVNARHVSTRLLVALAAVSLGCGGASEADASTDAGVDAGVRLDGGIDAGEMEVDAGEEEDDAGLPPRLVFGSMTVNGTPYTLSTGYGTQSTRHHRLYLGTAGDLQPRIQVTLVLPGDAVPGFSAVCGGPHPLLFAGQWSADGKVAFFTLNPTCAVTLSHVATAVDQEYCGTFSGTLDLEPRSILDAGFRVMTITDGTFRVTRTF